MSMINAGKFFWRTLNSIETGKKPFDEASQLFKDFAGEINGKYEIMSGQDWEAGDGMVPPIVAPVVNFFRLFNDTDKFDAETHRRSHSLDYLFTTVKVTAKYRAWQIVFSISCSQYDSTVSHLLVNCELDPKKTCSLELFRCDGTDGKEIEKH